jgi:hypothetical protein
VAEVSRRVNHSRRRFPRARGAPTQRAPPADRPGSRRRRRAAAADRGRRFLFCNSGSGRTVELGRSGRTIMRPRADRSAPARRIPAGAAADPRRPSSRPRRLSYAVAVANSPIDKSAAPVRPPLPPIAPRCGCQYRIRAQSSARRTAPVSSIPRGASSRGRRLG